MRMTNELCVCALERMLRMIDGRLDCLLYAQQLKCSTITIRVQYTIYSIHRRVELYTRVDERPAAVRGEEQRGADNTERRGEKPRRQRQAGDSGADADPCRDVRCLEGREARRARARARERERERDQWSSDRIASHRFASDHIAERKRRCRQRYL